MKDYLVSIIVPVYNVERYLEDCIGSIESQTYNNIEIILVDDGSTDKSPEICDYYAQNDTRIIVIHQENKGLPGARNSGIRASHGEWILFVDSDDWIAENAVELLLRKIETNIDLLIYNFRKMKTFNPVKEALGSGKTIELNEVDVFNLMLDSFDPMKERCGIFHEGKVAAWSKLYRRDFLNKNDLFFFEEVKIHEDIPFTVCAYMNKPRCLYVDYDIYQYRVTQYSITNSFRKNYIYELDILLDRMKDLSSMIDNQELACELFYNRVAVCAINLGIKYFCHKDNDKSYNERKMEYLSLLNREPYRTMRIIIYEKKFLLKKRIITYFLKKRSFCILNLFIKCLR